MLILDCTTPFLPFYLSLSLLQLPARIAHTTRYYYETLLEAVTAHGTLGGLPLPSLSKQPPTPPAPPALPPTAWERLIRHIRLRPWFYALLAGVPFTLTSTFLAVHYSSPSVRSRIFNHAPFLRSAYLSVYSPSGRRRRRALPRTPRPRQSPDGRTRLEAVLLLGCDSGSYGREVARAFEKQGFVVVASVSSQDQVEELEKLGNGNIKAIVLDASDVSDTLSVSSALPLPPSSFFSPLSSSSSSSHPSPSRLLFLPLSPLRSPH